MEPLEEFKNVFSNRSITSFRTPLLTILPKQSFAVSMFRHAFPKDRNILHVFWGDPTLRAYCKRFFWCPLLRVNQLLFTSARLLMEEIRLTSWYGKSPIICRVSYIPGDAGFLPSTVAFKHMELDPWLTSPDSPEKRATGREGGRHCKRSALKVAEESNGCTSLPRFKSKCQFKYSRFAKTSKARVREFYPHGKFCQSNRNTQYLLYPFGFSFGHSKKHNSQLLKQPVSPCCQVSESRPGTPGFLSSKSHPALWRFRRSKFDCGGYGSVPDFYTIYCIYTYYIYKYLTI